MSRFNPASHLSFQPTVMGDRSVVVGRVEGEDVGYFTQGEDGQWWWFSYNGRDDTGQPFSASNLMQIVAKCHELNANGV